MTLEEWLDAAFQADLAAFLASLGDPADTCSDEADGEFQFSAFDLSVLNIEVVEVLVDGSQVDATDEAVVANDDIAGSINADAASGLTGNVLVNDEIPDLVHSVELRDGPAYGTVQMGSDAVTLIWSMGMPMQSKHWPPEKR